MRNTCYLACLVSAWFGLLPAVPGASAQDEVKKPPPLDEKLLGWLPADTETVIVAKGPFGIPEVGTHPSPDTKPDELFESQLQTIGLGTAIMDGSEKAPAVMLEDEKLRLIVSGGRRFRAPRGFGLGPFEGCDILVFEKSSVDALTRAFEAIIEQADETLDVAGQQVAVYRRTRENDEWTFFFAHPKPDILLCATDQPYLQEVLSRMAEKPEDRALPKDLGLWKHVDVSARYWAVRQYRRKNVAKDPTSPHNAEAADTVPDTQAIGFVFWYDPGEKAKPKARYLSGAENIAEIARQWWQKVLPPFKSIDISKIEDGVVEIIIPLDDGFIAYRSYFLLMPCLGQAIRL